MLWTIGKLLTFEAPFWSLKKYISTLLLMQTHFAYDILHLSGENLIRSADAQQNVLFINPVENVTILQLFP